MCLWFCFLETEQWEFLNKSDATAKHREVSVEKPYFPNYASLTRKPKSYYPYVWEEFLHICKFAWQVGRNLYHYQAIRIAPAPDLCTIQIHPILLYKRKNLSCKPPYSIYITNLSPFNTLGLDQQWWAALDASTVIFPSLFHKNWRKSNL